LTAVFMVSLFILKLALTIRISDNTYAKA